MHEFKLYVTGQDTSAKPVVQATRLLLEGRYGKDYHLEVIDALEKPQSLLDKGIFATPILIRISPDPERRIIGDLNDTQRVLSILEKSDASQQ